MKLRPEFHLLNNHFRKLFKNKDVDLDFLNIVETHVRVCEHLAESDVEKNLITRTTYWRKKRLLEVTAKIELGHQLSEPVQEKPTDLSKYEFTEDDLKFLKHIESLNVGSDKPPKNKDDGA